MAALGVGSESMVAYSPDTGGGDRLFRAVLSRPKLGAESMADECVRLAASVRGDMGRYGEIWGDMAASVRGGGGLARRGVVEEVAPSHMLKEPVFSSGQRWPGGV